MREERALGLHLVQSNGLLLNNFDREGRGHAEVPNLLALVLRFPEQFRNVVRVYALTALVKLEILANELW
jgi:hypothetical protein